MYHFLRILINLVYSGAFVGEDVVSPHHPEEIGLHPANIRHYIWRSSAGAGFDVGKVVAVRAVSQR